MKPFRQPGRFRYYTVLCASLLLPSPSLLAGERKAYPPVPAFGQILETLDPGIAATWARLDEERKMRFFTAIAENDRRTFAAMLNEGMDPNCTLPFPPPPAFTKKFTDELLSYYVSSEPGFTALMMASAMNNLPFVKILLIAGADPWKLTKRHKTFALWLAGKYGNVEVMQSLMKIEPGNDALNWRIVVDLTSQRAIVWHKDKIALETSISSGRESHPTPKGRFVVTNKYKTWRSTLYPARMPYFLRLSCGDFGFHIGNLPGYPASHGCIRLPEKSARMLYDEVPLGAVVEIR